MMAQTTQFRPEVCFSRVSLMKNFPMESKNPKKIENCTHRESPAKRKID
jgi:hypothetical protein